MGMLPHGDISGSGLATFDFAACPAYKKRFGQRTPRRNNKYNKRATARIALTTYFDSVCLRPFEYL
jgi:hypothetical protein